MKVFLGIAALITLTACSTPTPIVSDFNGSSVKITQDNFLGEGGRNASTDAEANRICQLGSGKRAEYASVRQSAQYQVEHFYLCL